MKAEVESESTWSSTLVYCGEGWSGFQNMIGVDLGNCHSNTPFVFEVTNRSRSMPASLHDNFKSVEPLRVLQETWKWT